MKDNIKKAVRRIIVLTTVAIALSCASVPTDRSRKVEELIQKRIDELGITGLTAAVVYEGKPLVTEGFGLRETVPEQMPVTEHTLFQIGSTTKIITALGVMQLAEEGKIDLDVDIRTYIPEFAPRSLSSTGDTSVTVRSLLTHHSGLPSAYFKDFVQEISEPEEFMNTSLMLSEEYLVWDNGTVFAYNNVGFSLLGELIARVSGISYQQFITDRIFNPLGMRDALVFLSDEGAPIISGGFSLGKPEEQMQPIRDIPAGSVLLSAKDMELFLMELLDCSAGNSDKLVKPATLRSMFIRQNSDIHLDGSFAIGLGFWIESLKGQETYGHGGTIPPFYSEMKILPGKDTGIFLASNDNAGNNEVLSLLMEDIADLLIEGDTSPGTRPVPSPPSESELSDLAGYYAISGGIGLTSIAYRDGSWTVRNPECEIDAPLQFLSDGSILFGDSGFSMKPADTDKAAYLCYMGSIFIGPVTAVSPETVPPVWMRRTGSYSASGIFSEVDLSFDVNAGVLTLQVGSEKLGSMRLPLTVLTDNLLRVQGYGRNTGNIIEYRSSKSGEILRYAGIDYSKEN